MAKTTSDLLTNIKRRSQLPDDGGTLSDLDILAMATDELQNVVYPRLLAVNEWHYAFTYTKALSSVRNYRINPRCAGNRIISVEYYDGTNYRFIRLKHPLLQRQDLGENYAIYGNNIVVSDAVSTSGSLRIRAVVRPSKLVSTGCASIISCSSGNLTVDSSSGFSVDQTVDLVAGSSPYELVVAETGIQGTGVGSIAVAVTTADQDIALSTRGSNNDIDPGRCCPVETTDRVPLPDEFHDYLAQRTAIRCMEARGLTQDMQNHLRKLADLESAFDRLASPRSKGEFKAIVPEEWMFIGRV